MTGQHDREDEKLTGQLLNQSGHCPLTGRYFEPCNMVLFAADRIALKLWITHNYNNSVLTRGESCGSVLGLMHQSI